MHVGGLLLLVLIGAGLIAFVLARRAARRVDSSHGPSCARCGYAVRGLPSFTCPECGSDLREVGIHAPGVNPRPDSVVRKVGVWSIMILMIGSVISAMVINTCLPTVQSRYQDCSILGPRSGQYRRVDFHGEGCNLHWPYKQQLRPPSISALDITLTLNDGHTLALRATFDELGYEYTDTQGHRVQGATGLNEQVVLNWMRSGGIDVNKAGVETEVAEIAQIAKDAPHGSMNAASPTVFSGPPSTSNGFSYLPPRIATPIAVFFWIVVWLIGVRRILRRQRERLAATPPRSSQHQVV